MHFGATVRPTDRCLHQRTASIALHDLKLLKEDGWRWGGFDPRICEMLLRRRRRRLLLLLLLCLLGRRLFLPLPLLLPGATDLASPAVGLALSSTTAVETGRVAADVPANTTALAASSLAAPTVARAQHEIGMHDDARIGDRALMTTA